jgi:flagellar biosynthesis protein FlhB
MAEIKPKEYDSNPFTLSFNALGRFFHSNAGWAIVVIVLGVLGFLFQMGSNLAQVASNSSGSTSSSYTPPSSSSLEPAVIIAIVVFVGVLVLVAIVIGTVMKVYFQGMFSYVALKSEDGQAVSFKEAFDEVTKRFWRLFLAQLLADLKILGWYLLLIVPGVIASLRYSLLPYQIMSDPATEKNIKDSHDKTKAVSKGRLIEVFGVSTVSALIPVVGSLVGLSGKAALFNQLDHYNQKNIQKPKVHWLNYLGFILLAVLLLFIGLILGIVVIAVLTNNS